MRLGKLSLSISVLLVVLGSAVIREAFADTAIAKRSARVFAEPGEQSTPVTRVRAGKRMTVLQNDGRWVKVRVNGRTGWITRSNLVESAPPPREKKRDTSFVEGRSRRDPSDDAPIDRIGADATGTGVVDNAETEEVVPEDVGRAEESTERVTETVRTRVSEQPPAPRDKSRAVVRAGEAELLEKPNLSSNPVEFVEEGESLKILEDQGEWILVEHKSGTKGWVQSKSLEVGGAPAAGRVEGSTAAPEEDEPEDDLSVPYKYEKLALRAYAHLGVSANSQKFNSNGTGNLANYNTSASSIGALVGGELIYDFSKNYLLGADLQLSFSRSMGGIAFMNEKIGFSNVVADVGALGGYKFKKANGMAAYGRLGLYYSKQDVQGSTGTMLNAARIPSESLFGPKLGGMIDIPRLTERFSMRAHLDVMLGPLFTSRGQTSNLEDGANSNAHAAFLGARVDYRWKSGYTFSGSYDFNLAMTSWSGMAPMSMRGIGSTTAKRTDMTHVLMFGAGKSF